LSRRKKKGVFHRGGRLPERWAGQKNDEPKEEDVQNRKRNDATVIPKKRIKPEEAGHQGGGGEKGVEYLNSERRATVRVKRRCRDSDSLSERCGHKSKTSGVTVSD